MVYKLLNEQVKYILNLLTFCECPVFFESRSVISFGGVHVSIGDTLATARLDVDVVVLDVVDKALVEEVKGKCSFNNLRASDK